MHSLVGTTITKRRATASTSGTRIIDPYRASGAMARTMGPSLGWLAPRRAAQDADHDQQQHRPADRNEPRAEVEEVVDLADVEAGGQVAADQRAKDADRRRSDAAARLGAPGHERLRDGARAEPEDDPGEKAHAGTLLSR